MNNLAANPFIRNDDCQTPLDVARTKGYCNVVRVIEVLFLLIFVEFRFVF